VREGRRREFRHFLGFASQEISDPNARDSFDCCRLTTAGDDSFYRTLLALRRTAVVPRLDGARAIDAQVIGPGAVSARWRLGDGSELTIAANLATEACAFTGPELAPVYESRAGALSHGTLHGRSTVAFLSAPS
jgi:1,4-alpha-glucan branching enzyme